MSQGKVQKIVQILRERGVRITPSRRTVVEAIVSANGHVTADEISEAVESKFPEIHLSTVYRTLDMLEDSGIVDHVHLGHGKAVYHLKNEMHRHLVCEKCSMVIEISEDVLAPLLNEVKEKWHFTLKGDHFALLGLCENCSKEFENH